MAARSTDEREEAAPVQGEAPPAVTSHRTCPERFVFTEEDNSDGWIATDHVVDLER